MNGAELIAAERVRQIYGEGWTAEHDAGRCTGDLARAAHCYIHAAELNMSRSPLPGRLPKNWPWEDEFWKPSPDPIRNLVKAGALIAAEIDRLQAAPPVEPKETK